MPEEKDFKPNFNPVFRQDDFGQSAKPISGALFTREPELKELGEGIPVFSVFNSFNRMYVRIRGKRYFVDLTEV